MFARKTLSTTIALAAAASISPAGMAAKKLEEVIVTATKTARSMQDVPVSVTALTGERLESIDSFQDYVAQLPNVTFQGTGPGQNEIYIRGAATSQTIISLSSAAGLQPSVALYQDEMPVAVAGRNLDIYTTDMERVEVLPGPQGTLFGASSQAGTIRLITNKPQHSGFAAGFDTSIRTTEGGEMSNSVEAYMNLPLHDKLAVRVAAFNDRQGGWIDNVLNDPDAGGYRGSPLVISRVSGGVLADPENTPIEVPTNNALVEDDFNDAVYTGARFGLSWLINDKWDLLLQHTAQSLDTEGVWSYNPTLGDEDEAVRFVPDENEDDFGLTTWTLEGRLAQLDVIYTGGYLDREFDSIMDYTHYTNGGAFAAFYNCIYGAGVEDMCFDPATFYKEDTENTRFTNEIRINTPQDRRWRVTAGIFLDEQELATIGEFQLFSAGVNDDLSVFLANPNAEGINSNGGPFGPLVSFVNDVTRTTEQIATFGQLEFDLTPDITASFGARWYEIDDTYEGSTTTVDVTGRLDAFGDGSLEGLTEFFGAEEGAALYEAIQSGQLNLDDLDDSGTLSVDDVIVRASLDWRINEQIMVFATYAQGFRPPVTNRVGGSLATNQSDPAFQGFRIPVGSTTDDLDNYELGIKGDFFDRTLRFNATAYYSEITDLQTARFDPANISFLWFLDNVGDAEIMGIDGDFTWLPTANLTIGGAFSFLDTEITSLNASLTDIAPPEGSELPFSADFSFSLNARYDFSLPDDRLDAYLKGTLTYRGDSLAGMAMNAYVLEDATRLIYGRGSGLDIERESDVYAGATYPDSEGNTIPGGRYVQEAYTIMDVAFGVTNGAWVAEFFVKNLADEDAMLNIDVNSNTPKVITNRPRTWGLRFSYDFE